MILRPMEISEELSEIPQTTATGKESHRAYLSNQLRDPILERTLGTEDYKRLMSEDVKKAQVE